MDEWAGPATLPVPGARVPAGTCHVWPIAVADRPQWTALLPPDELERATQFRVPGPRHIFTTSRAAQRLVLAHYLGLDPHDVKIARGCEHCGKDHGRPRVEGAPLDFSVSHSQRWLLIAVVGTGRVGVDLEDLDARRSLDDVAAHTLSLREKYRFSQVPPDERGAWFLRLWTRKEATVKLTGHGLATELDRLDVIDPVAEITEPPAGWPAGPIHLTDLPTGPRQPAALASTEPVTEIVRCALPVG